MPLQSHVGLITNSSTTSTSTTTSFSFPPSFSPNTTTTTCYPYLSARLANEQLHFSLLCHFRHFPVDMCFCQRLDLPEITSRELSNCDLRKHLSLSPSFCLSSLYVSPPFLPLMPAHCSHLWRHHLIFPPFRQKHPEIDRKASSGDQARGFSASQSMSWC